MRAKVSFAALLMIGGLYVAACTTGAIRQAEAPAVTEPVCKDGKCEIPQPKTVKIGEPSLEWKRGR